MRLVLFLALAAALAAPIPLRAQSAEVFSDQLARLSQPQQLAALRRAVLDSGSSCHRPSEARRQGPYKNLIMWSVRCIPGGDYGVFIGPAANVQVRRCEELRQLKLPLCALPPAKPMPSPKPLRHRP